MPHRADTPAAADDASPPRRSQVFVYPDGFMFACEGMSAPRTERYTATLLFATSDAGIEVELDGQRQTVHNLVLKPFVPKAVMAPSQPFVSVGLNPDHPAFRAFTRLRAPGYTALPAEAFPLLTPQLHALQSGTLDLAQSRQVFDLCVVAASQTLPALRPMDPRIERVASQLALDHRQALDTLADKVCLSYYRLSHLFSQEMGLTLRQYMLSLKIHAAARCIGAGLSLTATAHQAGFTDSAHLSRVWTKAFGAPPSFFLNERRFDIQPPRGTQSFDQAA